MVMLSARTPKLTSKPLRLGGRLLFTRPSMMLGVHGRRLLRSAHPSPNLVRKRDIVDKTELLVTAPADAVEHLQSRTWPTVHYARRLGRPISIIRPDGSVIREP